MPAKRCSICNLNLPVDYPTANCPICLDEPLSGIQNCEPDDSEDAHRRTSLAQFEREFGPADVEAYEASLA